MIACWTTDNANILCGSTTPSLVLSSRSESLSDESSGVTRSAGMVTPSLFPFPHSPFVWNHLLKIERHLFCRGCNHFSVLRKGELCCAGPVKLPGYKTGHSRNSFARNNPNKIRRPICYVNILVNGSFPFRSAHYPQSKSYPNLPLPPEGEILTKLFRMPPGCFN